MLTLHISTTSFESPTYITIMSEFVLVFRDFNYYFLKKAHLGNVHTERCVDAQRFPCTIFCHSLMILFHWITTNIRKVLPNSNRMNSKS